MPFSKTTNKHTKEYWTEHFEKILKPLIEEVPNLEALRSEPLRGNILNQIVTNLFTSRIVVADLTDNKPNVYWELGVRQSYRHGTVLIAEEGTELPFDIFSQGTLFYDHDDTFKWESFRRRFKEALKDCLKYPERPDSHVLEALGGRGSLFEILNRDEVIRKLDAVLSECDLNLKIINKVTKGAKNNLANPSKRKFSVRRLSLSAVELLITNRYITEDQSFFESAEHYKTWILSVNHELERWAHFPSSTDKWLEKNLKIINKILQTFQSSVEVIHEKLLRQT